MSKANPRKAVTAIMPLPLQVGTENGEPLVVRPMTLAMYAALERIGSPLLTGQEPENALDWLPTLYLVTHDPSEIFSGNLADKAFAWADAQPVSVVRRIRDAAMRQIDALVDVIPEADRLREVFGDQAREAAYRQMNAAFDVIPEEGESKKIS